MFAKLSLALGLLALVCAQAAPETALDVLQGSGEYSALAAAIKKAGLESKLGPDFKGTVLVPNNAAIAEFKALLASFGRSDESLESASSEVLALVLSDHVSPDAVAQPLKDGQVIPTLRGKDLTVDISDGIPVLVGNGVSAGVSGAPIQTGNGATLIPIDAVLQFVNHKTNARRSLMGGRHLLCSCAGLTGCCGSGCACCNGCSWEFCSC